MPSRDFSSTYLVVLSFQAVLAAKGEKRATAAQGGVASAPCASEATAEANANSGSPPSPRPPPPPSSEEQQEGEGKGDSEEKVEKRQDKKGDDEAEMGEGECKAEHLQSDGKTKREEEKGGDDGDRAEEGGAEEEGKEGGSEEEGISEEEQETRREQRADVSRHMAKLYITVLQAKYQEQGRQGGGEFSRVRRPEQDGQEDDSGLCPGFASLGIGELPMCDPSAVSSSFESVRDVFKRAKVCMWVDDGGAVVCMRAGPAGGAHVVTSVCCFVLS